MITGTLATILFIAYLLFAAIWIGYVMYRVRRRWHQQLGGYTPLVEPAPDAFPLRYRSPYVPGGPDATLNQRLIRMGYTPVENGNRPFFSGTPQSDTAPVVGDLAKSVDVAPPGFYHALDLLNRAGNPIPLQSVDHYYTAEDCYEAAPYPTNSADGLQIIECEVNYE